MTVRSSVGHWHQSNDCSSRVPAQHSQTRLLSRGTRTDTTNYWLCSHRESLSHQQERPSSSPYSSSPPATPLCLCTLQTALPYRWVTHWQPERQQPPPAALRPWSHCSEPALPQTQASLTCYTKGTSQGKVTAQLSPRWWMWRPRAAWAPPPHWSAKFSGFSREHKHAVGTKAQRQPPNLQGKKLSSVYIRFS